MIGIWNYNISTVLITMLGVILTSISLLPPPTSGGVTNKIDPELKRKIDSAPTGSTWDIIIEFKKDPNVNAAISASVAHITDTYRRTYETVMQLTKNANESQGKVLEVLKKLKDSGIKLRYKTLLIDNELAVYGASKMLIDMLGDTEKPENANITGIFEDELINMLIPAVPGTGRPVRQGQGGLKEPLPENWGIKQINAQAWWDKNYNGTGVIVGHLDSGVDVRHPSLKWNWMGKPYGWLDAGNEKNTFPFESNPEESHGTHTIGSIIGRGVGPSGSKKESDVGFFGVGVAPGARWISCLACRRDEKRGIPCVTSYLKECGDFLLCPDKETGCSLKPDVISVSIGCSQNITTRCYYSKERGYWGGVVNQWTENGIIPVFAAGNWGRQGCRSVAHPADLEEVIAVGAIDENDRLWDKSSMGPPEWRYNLTEIRARKIFKPDFTAPGVNIYSTVHTGMDGSFEFKYFSGTSMAAPYVAGAIALLFSRSEHLRMNNIREIFEGAAINNSDLRYPFDSPKKCGEADDHDGVNHKSGSGRLRLPNPEDVKFPIRLPTRKMPPPPDYTDLADDATPTLVRPGMVGVVMMIVLINFLGNVVINN